MYQLNEATIDIPDNWVDKSMNIFVSAETGSQGISLVIARERLPWGMEFKEFAEGEMAKISKQLQQFKELSRDDLEIPNCIAKLFEYTWTNHQTDTHQILVMIAKERALMLITFSMPGFMSDSQKAHAMRILNSLTFRDAAVKKM
jgi:hypothetical protein